MNKSRVALFTASLFVSSLAGADGPKERREDRKERREERRADRKEDAGAEGAGEAGLPEEWRAKHRAWTEKRKDRREERRDALKKKWGDTLQKPAAVAELKKHGRRVARLARVMFLAEASGKTETVAAAKALLEKERARHEKRMTALQAEVAK